MVDKIVEGVSMFLLGFVLGFVLVGVKLVG